MSTLRLTTLLLLFPITAFANLFSEQTVSTNPRGYIFEIHGSNTIGASLAPALIEKWFSANGATSVKTILTNIENEKKVTATFTSGASAEVFIAAHGSGTGFKKISEGLADIAAASRPAKTSENDLFPTVDVTSYQSELVLAIDGIAVIINPDLPLESLNINEVGKLFSGEIKNWSEMGGPNIAVNVHARDDKSGTYDTFNTLVLKRGFSLTNSARRYESNDVLSETVSKTPGAIGFTSLASIGTSKPVAIVDGESSPMLPLASSIATEDYPLARRLYLYQVKSTNPYATDFLEFAKHSTGQTVVSDVGFVSQNLEAIEVKVQGSLPAGYSFITEKSQRITTNFRFRGDSKSLDNKALDDLVRLADYMSRPENQSRKLFLIGFSNKQKDEFKARLMSEARVISVKRELQKHGITSSALTGYGQVNPVASNDDLKYALRNQRVEVWIR
jgi:phosphate transport system substrate-binding protein